MTEDRAFLRAYSELVEGFYNVEPIEAGDPLSPTSLKIQGLQTRVRRYRNSLGVLAEQTRSFIGLMGVIAPPRPGSPLEKAAIALVHCIEANTEQPGMSPEQLGLFGHST